MRSIQEEVKTLETPVLFWIWLRQLHICRAPELIWLQKILVLVRKHFLPTNRKEGLQHLAWIRQNWRPSTGKKLMGEVLMKEWVRQLVPRDKSYTVSSLILSSPTSPSLDSPESNQSKQMGKNTISCRATRNPNTIPSRVLGQHTNLSSARCYWKWPGELTRQ